MAIFRLCFLGLLLGASLACAPNQLYQRRDLDAALLKHHQNFRWGRLEQASTFIQPELRKDFISSWMKQAQKMDLHSLEVLSVEEKNMGDRVEVTLRIQWINNDNMNLQARLLQEIWVRTSQGWLLAAPIFPRDLFAQKYP